MCVSFLISIESSVDHSKILTLDSRVLMSFQFRPYNSKQLECSRSASRLSLPIYVLYTGNQIPLQQRCILVTPRRQRWMNPSC